MHRDGHDIFHFVPATYASEMVVPESCAVPVRRDVPLDLAALIGCSVATGVGAVLHTAQAQAGQICAVAIVTSGRDIRARSRELASYSRPDEPEGSSPVDATRPASVPGLAVMIPITMRAR